MLEIDFNGNPFEDSKNIKDDFIPASMAELDKVNTLAVAVYFDIKLNDANPYEKGFPVSLKTEANSRYGFIQNISKDTVGRVSAILGHNYVNISFESTIPATIKNVPINHLVLKHPSFFVKVKVFLKSVSFIKKLILKTIKRKRK